MVQHYALCWHQIKKFIKLFAGEKEEITSVIYPRIDMYRLVTFCVVEGKELVFWGEIPPLGDRSWMANALRKSQQCSAALEGVTLDHIFG